DDVGIGRVRTADADANAAEVGRPESFAQRLEPVVAGQAPADARLDAPERQVDLVVDHEDALERQLERAARRADRLARVVHVGLRDEDRDARAAGAGAPDREATAVLVLRAREVP